MISGIAFDLPDSLGHLRAFPDHFKIYKILTIVRMELNSIQAIDRGRLTHPRHLRVWVASSYDCPDRLNII